MFSIADLCWSFSALRPDQGSNAAASVGMINSVIWIFLHLPAALLASLAFGGQSKGETALPTSEIVAMAALGMVQMSLLGLVLGWWMDRRTKP